MCKENHSYILLRCSIIIITLPEISDYTIREFVYGVQDTIYCSSTRAHIAFEIIPVSNPG